MAENAIQIIIDVLSQEGVDSLNTFVKALSSAYERAGMLSESVDELDTTLGGLAKSGSTAEDVAAELAGTLKDFGVQVTDTDGFVKALADALKGLGLAGEDASAGIEKADLANKELADSANFVSASLRKEGAALKTVATEADLYAAAVQSARARAAMGAVEEKAAVDNLGLGYARLETLSNLATPALMKAATWAGVGLAGLAYEGIKQYTQFQRLITQTITQAGEAPSKMGFLTNLAESVAKTTGQNLDDVANSIYRAASGTASWNNGLGATKKQLTDIVTQVSKLNVLGNISGGAESEQASRVITALINANIRGIGRNPALAAALTNAAVGSGDMRLGDLVPGIGRGVLQSAVANNVTAKDAFAWIADLTSTGTTASVAGNYVKTGINLLANPSAQGTDVLSMIGIKPGEIGRLLSSPGGLVTVAKTLKQAMNQLNPESIAGYFFDTTGHVRAGGGGLQGAIDKLQTMSANELSPQFIKDWESGKLTTAEKQQAFSLILDKAYGGSKQFATIASILNNPSLLQNIESHISAEDNLGYLRRSEARAEATPSQQFKRMEQSLLVDLVNIGKDLTPIALTFSHVLTDIIGGMTKFKSVIMGFVGLAVSILGFAGITKAAEIAKGISPYIGAGYNRLGTAFKGTAFGDAMTAKANSGRFAFLDIYKAKRHGILSKLGGEAIGSNQLPSDASLGAGTASVEGATAGENAIVSAVARSNVLLDSVVRNTGVIAEENGGIGSGGALRAGEKGAGAEEAALGSRVYSPQLKDPVTGKFLSYADSEALLARQQEEQNAASMGAYYFGATGKGRGIKSFRTGMNGGAETAAQNMADKTAAMTDAATSDVADAVSTGTSTVANTIVPLADKAGGFLSGAGEMLGGLAGGPLGMVGMMMAPMAIGALTPLIGKIGSFIGSLFGGGGSKTYIPKVNHPLDNYQASKKALAALKVLHDNFYTEHKNKAGKEIWSLNPTAVAANLVGYNKDLTSYQMAMHTYDGALKNSASTYSEDFNEIYGSQGAALAKFKSTMLRDAKNPSTWSEQNYLSNVASLRRYAQTLPGPARRAVLKMIGKNPNSTNLWSYAAKDVTKEQSIAKGQLGDLFDSSLKDQEKYDPMIAALNAGGFFDAKNSIQTASADLKRNLSSKHLTVEEAAKGFPLVAHMFHQALVEDNKELATKNLPAAAKAYLEKQKNEAEEGLQKTDEMIRVFREAAKNTHLANESVDKLAKENASQLVASGLPVAIATALANLLNPYLKQPRVQGTSGPASRTVNPSSQGSLSTPIG